MAENESLDLGKSRRWRRVLDAVVDGKSAEQIASVAAESLRKTVNALHKPVFDRSSPQVPLADMLNAVLHDPCEVDRIVRRCHGHDFAYLFHDSTLGAESREDAAKKFLSAICEKYFDKIELQVVKADGQHTVGRVRSQLDQVQAHLRSDIKRFAQKLAANPNRILRRPWVSSAAKAIINTPSILKESLLGIKR